MTHKAQTQGEVRVAPSFEVLVSSSGLVRKISIFTGQSKSARSNGTVSSTNELSGSDTCSNFGSMVWHTLCSEPQHHPSTPPPVGQSEFRVVSLQALGRSWSGNRLESQPKTEVGERTRLQRTGSQLGSLRWPNRNLAARSA